MDHHPTASPMAAKFQLPHISKAKAEEYDSIGDVFRDAFDAFVKGLALKDQLRLSSATGLPTPESSVSSQDVCEALKSLAGVAARGNKGTAQKSLASVKKFTDRLQPYFDALNSVAAGNNFASLAYGSLRLVLQVRRSLRSWRPKFDVKWNQLAGAFPLFVEKYLVFIEELADAFPQYDAVIQILTKLTTRDGTQGRLRHHLGLVYQDIFEFLRISARIFTASDGSKSSPTNVFSSASASDQCLFIYVCIRGVCKLILAKKSDVQQLSSRP